MSQYVPLNVPVHHSHWVYRLWAADGTCLYVGVTSGVVIKRVAEHFRKPRQDGRHLPRDPWHHEIDHIDVAEFTDRATAEAEEFEQIRALRPRENSDFTKERCYRGDGRKAAVSQWTKDRYRDDPVFRDKVLAQSTQWTHDNRVRHNEIARQSQQRRRDREKEELCQPLLSS